MLCLIDEFTREALAIRVKRKLNSLDVLETLAEVMISRGRPDYIRSDNGPEFIAKTLRSWIANVGTQSAYIEPGSPWENGYCEASTVSFAMNC
jgi:putative transposase